MSSIDIHLFEISITQIFDGDIDDISSITLIYRKNEKCETFFSLTKIYLVILTIHDKICAIIGTKYGDGVYSIDSGGSDIFKLM